MRRVWKNKWGVVEKDESGYVLIMALFVLFIVSLVGVALAVIGIQEFNLSARTKLMDQAYSIAEAGVNRAAVEIKLDRSITSTTPDGAHDYGDAGDTPQWQSSEAFGNGTFTVQIYQSEVIRSNPAMKVIVATGSISRSDKSAERTIETRITSSAGGDYDASFDYCIYNGCKDSRATAWPDVDFLAGNFQIDGATPYPDPNDPSTPVGATPHYPKGAVYTRGTIDFPTRLASGVTIYGNVIAEDDIYLSNVYGVEAVGSGIHITGYDDPDTSDPDDHEAQVIAGLDGSGTLHVQFVSGLLSEQTITIYGYLCAANNVEITNNATISLDRTITMNGVVAGGDLLVTSAGGSVSGSSSGVELGNIFTAGKTSISAAASGGTRFSQINAGRDATGLGVFLETRTSGTIGRGSEACGPIFSEGKVVAQTNRNSTISVGNINAGTDTGEAPDYEGGVGVDITAVSATISMVKIRSRGRVNLNITSSSDITIGCESIFAGTDSNTGTGGTGINISASGRSVGITGSITAEGSVNVTASGFRGDIGKIWSGTNITANMTGFATNIQGMDAVGDVNFNVDLLGVVTLSKIRANNNVNVVFNTYIIGFNYLKGVEAGNDVSLLNHGYWIGISYLQANKLTDESADAWSGAEPAKDCIWAGGDVSYRSIASGFVFAYTNVDGEIEANGTISHSGFTSVGAEHPGVAGLLRWTPGIEHPGLPAMAPWIDEYGSEVQIAGGPENSDWTPLQSTPPDVDQETLLGIAGLDSKTELVEPNWFYFETAATHDHNVNALVPHLIRDREASETAGAGGDWGAPDDGKVVFRWDDTMPYSPQETVYCGDTWIDGTGNEVYVDVYIDKLMWTEEDAKFEGTIVSKGNIYISANNGDLWVESSDILNLVAGGNIEVTNAGTAIVKQANAHYHFWAVDDIVFHNSEFTVAGNDEFYGSLTAGNRVIYDSETLWQNTKFKWSRWALDPVAWLPPFKIYSWKEI